MRAMRDLTTGIVYSDAWLWLGEHAVTIAILATAALLIAIATSLGSNDGRGYGR